MKNKLTILLVAILANATLFAQNGSVIGKITDNVNNPLMGVTVLLKNETKGTQSNQDGSFEITNIENGDYVLAISYVGYKNREIPFSIANNTVNLNTLVLYEGNEILQEVFIEGTRTNQFSRKQTAYVAKLPLKDIENTQVYSTVTNKLLESQVVVSFEEALENAVGVEQLWTSTGRGGDGAGYYSLRGFAVQPKLVNGMPGITNGTINPANIERIEVIKGPSATLFGNSVSSYGGLINVVTKKPYIGNGGQISYTTGSYGFNQITGDFNTALDEANNIFFRLNTSYMTQQSYQDAGFSKSFFVAPSLSYQVNNKLSFSFYGEITTAEQTNPVFLFLNRGGPTEAQNIDELDYNYDLSFTSNELSLLNPTQNYRIQADYNISESWQSQTLVSSSSTSTEGYYSYLYDYGILPGNTFTRFINYQNSKTRTNDLQQNFIGDVKIGSLRNRIVVGLDYYTQTLTDNSTGYAFYGNVTPNGETNGDNPFTPGVEDDSYPLSAAGVDAALAPLGVGNYKSQYSTFSVYASDVLNITEDLLLNVGLRLDVFDNNGDVTTSEDDFTQTTLSPKFGLMYQPITDKLSVFANYQNGFTNVAPQLVGDPSDGAQTFKSFKPEEANQLEFGVKANLFNNRLEGTVSYYDIKVSNRVISDPDSPFNKIQAGEVVSKGFEFEIIANPVDGLNIIAGYSNNDSETTKTDNANIEGRRPLEAGPEQVYNFWATYEFQENTALNGFGAGAGFNGASESYAINYAVTGDFMLPAYTIANASIFYQAPKYRISLKLNNVFNEEYYRGWSTITPQNPRTFLANFTYNF